ncbi:digeranylgeranylglycerophospholipid reductase [Methanobrevibacter arboriphilus]|jgi:digeranylgeranylglycerophospholipid reductase|uniref:Digeranylgeranylglycerophospholipid reductase n=1 Tax=Methanobrevibacter arboriphilus TaxID=39441 RepID=A0ACA8R061_METAZ|nr:NAD(P)/FAD-dependent oxidoreductase [Methanobrevibacter arboriphilus]MCC7561574.1 NAD(P)/FAD-dependent oxidoreductase [Methanobrevibacter arboriphilus]BBL60971.1 digeranylgeranylglycerophospholipid reductase [Methanobrevibacter arboriphilus]GLI12872.1 digeranylgeranylglycerophospholipid reductase [Methanobrevibacter arboriphilus]
MIKTDVLVIGSGPAGSSAAKHAALGGAKVIVIDKKSEIGAPKRCAEGVSKAGLADLGIEPNVRWVTKELDGVRLVSPNGTNVWLTSDEIELPEAGYILERKIFDKYMAMDAARAGAEIKIKTLAHGMRKEGDAYVVTCEHMGELFEIKANIIIAADGPESRVARWAGLRTATKATNMESGIQFEMVGVEMEKQDVIEFYFGSVAPGGYAWIFPKGDDIANVGLAVITNDTDKTPYEHLKDFVANCPATQNAQAVEFNIGGDPVGGMPKKIYDDNILVCGDAAGQVNPLTGGGIISGMKGGMHAGIVAASAIADGDFSKDRLKEYDKNIRDDIGHEIDKYLKVKDYALSLSDEELDSVADAFQDVEFEKVSTTELVKNLIKVSPKALLKLGKLL